AHIVVGTSIALALYGIVPDAQVATPIAGVLLIAYVMFVEGAARAGGFLRGMSAFNRLASFVVLVDIMFAPLTRLGAAVERALGRALPRAHESSVDREEGAEQFREVVAAEADVSAAEEELLHGIFSLGDTQVQEIMVPRVD